MTEDCELRNKFFISMKKEVKKTCDKEEESRRRREVNSSNMRSPLM